MTWRAISIGNAASLSFKNNGMVVKVGDDPPISVPLDDIGVVVLESRETRISGVLLSEVGSRGIALIACDEKHLPCAALIPFCQHSRASNAVKMQLAATEPFKKNCWRMIVSRKILNQSKCLELLALPGALELEALSLTVKSGDVDNREAVAAKIFFAATLVGDKRNSGGTRNAALDYGYAIIRATIARSLASHGFIPSIGIHHRSELNAFNLADDFIEPFRPIVDLWVGENVDAGEDFSIAHREGLVGVLNHLADVDGDQVTVLRAIELAASSFVSACRSKKPELLALPTLIPLCVKQAE